MSALDAAGVTFLTSVAYRTGLLETLARMPPSTSEEIARAAGLHRADRIASASSCPGRSG